MWKFKRGKNDVKIEVCLAFPTPTDDSVFINNLNSIDVLDVCGNDDVESAPDNAFITKRDFDVNVFAHGKLLYHNITR
jgi:hypothetical protein